VKALVRIGKKESRLLRPLIVVSVITLIIVSGITLSSFPKEENSALGTVIFSDGFESGDTSAWSWVMNVDVTPSFAHSGEYSAFCNTSDVYHVTTVGLSGSVGWGNHVSARGYFRLGSMLGVDRTYRILLYVSNWNGSDVMICDAGIYHLTGNYYAWAISYLNGPSLHFVQTSYFTLNLTSWYCIELESFIASSGGYFDLYVNDVTVLSAAGVNNAGRGVINHVGFGQDVTGQSYHVNTWWDDCVIADSYIGLEPPMPPVPSVSVESNVTITDETIRSTMIYFTASAATAQKGYVNATMPVGFNTTDLKVFIDTQLVQPPFPIITTNGTHYFIYFEFTLSTHTVIILFVRTGDLGSRVGSTNTFGAFDGVVSSADLNLFLLCYKGTAPENAMYLGDLGSRVNGQNRFLVFDDLVTSTDLQLFLICYKGQGP
jgi:hypothetical protein